MLQQADGARAEEEQMGHLDVAQPYVPMVFRRTPAARHRLSEAMTGVATSPGDVWWELVDPAAPSDAPPAGVALTRPVGADRTQVVVLRRSDDRDAHPTRDLLALLVTALRGTRALQLCMNPDDETPASALLEAGFIALEGSAASQEHVLTL
jgi:hypothetical protein